METVTTAYIDLACRATNAAEAVLMRHWQSGIIMDHKPDESPVTRADREAETVIRALITAERPKQGIHGEEFSKEGGQNEWQWLIDPLDGTHIHTRPFTSLDTAICTASGPGVIAREHWLKIYPLQRTCHWTMFGADISDYGSISSGFQDLIVNAQLGEDDWLGGAALIEAAGGRVTDWQGNALNPDSGGTILAVGDPTLLEPALAALNGSS